MSYPFYCKSDFKNPTFKPSKWNFVIKNGYVNEEGEEQQMALTVVFFK